MPIFTELPIESLLKRWFQEPRISQVEPIATGMSGGQVLRVRLDNCPHDWALKGSPTQSRPDRLSAITTWIHQAAPFCRLLVPPLATRESGQHFLSFSGRRWQCSRWVEGAAMPLKPSATDQVAESLPNDWFRAGAAALATAHNALSRISEPRLGKFSPSLGDRQRRLESSIREHAQLRLPPREILAGQLRHRVSPSFASGSEAWSNQWADRIWIAHQQWTRLIRGGTITRLSNQLQAVADALRDHPTFPVFRDVHRQHILFEPVTAANSELPVVAAIIDYDAVDRDHVAIDIARWVGDGDKANLHAVLAEYRAIRPFSDQQANLAELLIDINPICALVNWVQWSLSSDMELTTPPRLVIDRISRLIASVGRIC